MMAFTAGASSQPATNPATFVVRNNHLLLAFDTTTQETAYFGGVIPPSYAGGDIEVTIVWLAASATTGDCRWAVAFERHQDDAFDLDADGFAADIEATSTAASASGEPQYATLTFTQAAADGVAAGESFRLRVRRDPADAADNMAGDAQLLAVLLEEV